MSEPLPERLPEYAVLAPLLPTLRATALSPRSVNARLPLPAKPPKLAVPRPDVNCTKPSAPTVTVLFCTALEFPMTKKPLSVVGPV